jgi:hypothetical protein
MMRTFFVWIFLLNFSVGGSTETFTWWQLFGFLTLSLGVLVYNEIIVVPLFGFNKYTKIALEYRDRIYNEERK